MVKTKLLSNLINSFNGLVTIRISEMVNGNSECYLSNHNKVIYSPTYTFNVKMKAHRTSFSRQKTGNMDASTKVSAGFHTHYSIVEIRFMKQFSTSLSGKKR